MTTDTEIHTADNDVCGEHHSEFSNKYESQLRIDGAAIGECAQSDHQLDAFLKTLGDNADQVQKALLSRDRRHDLQFAAAAAYLFKTAEKSIGYLDNLLDQADVATAKNAASPERAKISAIIRFTASDAAASNRDVSVRVTRLSKTAVGIILLCENLGIAVHLGNIAQVIDIALGHNRSYFQKLVDAQDAANAPENTPVVEPDIAAPPASNPLSAAFGTAEKTEAGTTPATNAQQATPMSAGGVDPEPVTLKVLPPPSVSEAVRLAGIGTLPNKAALEDGVVVLIGRVEGDTIAVRGPISTTLADELLRSLEDAARSAA